MFCGTKRMCDQLAMNLSREYRAAAIHGDKKQQERDAVLAAFKVSPSPPTTLTSSQPALSPLPTLCLSTRTALPLLRTAPTQAGRTWLWSARVPVVFRVMTELTQHRRLIGRCEAGLPHRLRADSGMLCSNRSRFGL